MAVNNDESRAYLRSSGSSGTFNMLDSSTCSVSMWVQVLSFGPEVGPLTTLLFTQDETLYDGAGSNGTFVGGDGVGATEYAVGNLITLSNGSIITNGSIIIVDAVDINGDVTEFTVLSPGDADITGGVALTQEFTTGTGVDFTLTPEDNNITNGRKSLPTVDLLTLRGSDEEISFTISIIPDNVLPSPIDPTAAKVAVISTNATTGKKQSLMLSTTFDFTAGWTNILLSWNSAASTGHLYLNDSDELLTGVVNTEGEVVSSLFAPVFDGNDSGLIGDDPLDLSFLTNKPEIFAIGWTGISGSTLPTGATPAAWFDVSSTTTTYRFWFSDGSTMPPLLSQPPSTPETLTPIVFTGAETDQDISDLVVTALIAADADFSGADNLGGASTFVTTILATDGAVLNASDSSITYAPITFDAIPPVPTGANFIERQEGSGFLGTLTGPWNHLFAVTYPTASADVDVHEVYFNNAVEIDFSVLANRRDFITAGGLPENLGANGETPTGTSPALYLSNPAASYETNAGQNGDWITNGTFTDVAAPA